MLSRRPQIAVKITPSLVLQERQFQLIAKRPDLIALHVLDRHVVDLRGKQPFATLAGSHQQFHDRVAVQARDPLSGSDAVPLSRSYWRTTGRTMRLFDAAARFGR